MVEIDPLYTLRKTTQESRQETSSTGYVTISQSGKSVRYRPTGTNSVSCISNEMVDEINPLILKDTLDVSGQVVDTLKVRRSIMSRSEGCVVSSCSQVGCLVMSALDNPLARVSNFREVIVPPRTHSYVRLFLLSTS